MITAELAGRLLFAMLSGALIGIERQWHHKNAGLKTNTLVALGAAAFGLISVHGPAADIRVAAGVVTGIGFIGAGVIMRRGGSVQGINSAATLWATASLGLGIGLGNYDLACLVLVFVLATQFFARWVASWIDKRSGLVVPHITYHVDIHVDLASADKVRAVWSDFAKQSGISVLHYRETVTNGSKVEIQASLGLSELRAHDLSALGRSLGTRQGVFHFEWSQSIAAEDDESDRDHSPHRPIPPGGRL
jgi:putative Mg2+ transporter-C (MgtC) family protein